LRSIEKVANIAIGFAARLDQLKLAGGYFTLIAVVTSNIENILDGEFVAFLAGSSYDILVTALGAVAGAVAAGILAATVTPVASSVAIPLIVTLGVSYLISTLANYLDRELKLKALLATLLSQILQNGENNVMKALHDYRSMWFYLRTPNGLVWIMRQLAK